MKFVYFILVSLVISSCSDTNRSGYITEVIQIKSTIDSMEVAIDAMDFEPIQAILSNAELIEQKVKLLNMDTIPLILALEIDKCLAASSNLEVVMDGIEVLKKELDDAKETAISLENDISEDNGRREMYEEYIAFEAEKAEELRLILEEYSERMEQTLVIDEVSISSLIEKLDERIAAIQVQ